MNFLKLTPYIPNDEGYIKQDNAEIFINKDAVSVVCVDLTRNATRIELTNGAIHYVEENIYQIISRLKI